MPREVAQFVELALDFGHRRFEIGEGRIGRQAVRWLVQRHAGLSDAIGGLREGRLLLVKGGLPFVEFSL